MKHLLIALILLLSQTMAYASHRHEEEEKKSESQIKSNFDDQDPLMKKYSNKSPHIQSIVSHKFKTENPDWKRNKESRLMIIAEKLDDLFSNAGYLSVPGAMYLTDNAYMYLYTKQKEIILALCCYGGQSNILNLKEIDEDDSKINNLSWNHIALSLNCKIHPKKPRDKHTSIIKPSKEILNIFEIIKEKGKIDFIKRIAIVVDAQQNYNFYSIFNNKNKSSSGKKIIEELLQY